MDLSDAIIAAIMPYLQEMLKALATAIAGGLVWLVLEIARLVRYRVTAEQEAKLRYHAKAAVLEAEEKVEAQAKALAARGAQRLEDWLKDKARLKLEEALAALVRRIPRLASDPAKAQGAIHQILGETPGVGASKVPFVP